MNHQQNGAAQLGAWDFPLFGENSTEIHLQIPYLYQFLHSDFFLIFSISSFTWSINSPKASETLAMKRSFFL